MIPYYCARCGQLDAAGAQAHLCAFFQKTPIVTDAPKRKTAGVSVTPSVTDRRRKWEADNIEKHRGQAAKRMRKRRASGK